MIQVSQLTFLLLKKNIGTVESCPILGAKENYSELWHDCDIPPCGLGSREGNNEADEEMRERRRGAAEVDNANGLY